MQLQLTPHNCSKIKIGGVTFFLKSITPFDFLEYDDGVPFTMIKQKKVQTMYEKTVGHRKVDSSDSKKNFDCIMRVIQSGVSYLESGFFIKKRKAFDRNVFEKTTTNIGVVYMLYKKIIDLSLIKFKNPVELHYNQASYYAHLSEKCHKTPIEILFPSGGYTSMDAYIFNSYIISHKLKLESK